MGMYKSNLSPEQEKARSNVESVEAFLARGGSITKVAETQSKKRGKKSSKVDAQALLDKAIAAGQGEEMIKFLQEQGIEVQ